MTISQRLPCPTSLTADTGNRVPSLLRRRLVHFKEWKWKWEWIWQGVGINIFIPLYYIPTHEWIKSETEWIKSKSKLKMKMKMKQMNKQLPRLNKYGTKYVPNSNKNQTHEWIKSNKWRYRLTKPGKNEERDEQSWTRWTKSKKKRRTRWIKSNQMNKI